MQKTIVVCADIGSVEENFGWCSAEGQMGERPSSLAKYVANALNAGKPVALGFECPLYVPLEAEEHRLGKARPGEGNRAWSAYAGSAVLATGLAQVPWILRAIREELSQPVEAFLDRSDFSKANSGLLIWEAFVSGPAKQSDHIGDAKVGANAFSQALQNPLSTNVIECTGEVHSLIGAALLRTGWSKDVGLLSKPCLLVKATEP